MTRWNKAEVIIRFQGWICLIGLNLVLLDGILLIFCAQVVANVSYSFVLGAKIEDGDIVCMTWVEIITAALMVVKPWFIQSFCFVVAFSNAAERQEESIRHFDRILMYNWAIVSSLFHFLFCWASGLRMKYINFFFPKVFIWLCFVWFNHFENSEFNAVP